MNIPDALSKRIRRHLTGRVRDYFAVTAPGLEPLCLEELRHLPLSVQETRMVSGGVEFKGRLGDCWLANLHLRTANRILLRIAAFRASGFAELKRHTAAVDWEIYLRPDVHLSFHYAAVHARLYHGGAAAEHIAEGIRLRIPPPPAANGPEQAVFVRNVGDQVSLSLDSSGELLYRRGLKAHSHRAPLRETLAAAVLLLAGYAPDRPLVDPMCGSGSFALEAALLAKGIPPGWFRAFAFMHWPAFAPRRWEALRREAEAAFRALPQPAIFASDIDPAACRELGERLRQFQLADAVNVRQADFFDPEFRGDMPVKGLVVLNPPYGRRMGDSREAARFYARLGAKLARDFDGWQAAVLTPHPRLAKALPIRGNSFALRHGGLEVTVKLGEVRGRS